MKRVPRFQDRFNGVFEKTLEKLNSIKKKDMQSIIDYMIIDMQIIPFDPYTHFKGFYTIGEQENMRESFKYLCSYNL